MSLPKLAEAPKAKLRDITADDLKKLWELDQRRKALDRESSSIKKQQDLITDAVKAALAADDRTEVKRGDYRAELRDGQICPKWKEEFVRVAGAEAASEIQASTPPTKKLSVFRIGD